MGEIKNLKIVAQSQKKIKEGLVNGVILNLDGSVKCIIYAYTVYAYNMHFTLPSRFETEIGQKSGRFIVRLRKTDHCKSDEFFSKSADLK